MKNLKPDSLQQSRYTASVQLITLLGSSLNHEDILAALKRHHSATKLAIGLVGPMAEPFESQYLVSTLTITSDTKKALSSFETQWRGRFAVLLGFGSGRIQEMRLDGFIMDWADNGEHTTRYGAAVVESNYSIGQWLGEWGLKRPSGKPLFWGSDLKQGDTWHCKPVKGGEPELTVFVPPVELVQRSQTLLYLTIDPCPSFGFERHLAWISLQENHSRVLERNWPIDSSDRIKLPQEWISGAKVEWIRSDGAVTLEAFDFPAGHRRSA